MPTSAALDVVAKKLKLKFFEVRPILLYVFFALYNCKDGVYHLDSRVQCCVWKLANWSVILLVDPILNDFGRFSWARFCKDVFMKVVLVSNRCQQDGSFLETLWMLACALCAVKRVLEQVFIWPVSIIYKCCILYTVLISILSSQIRLIIPQSVM